MNRNVRDDILAEIRRNADRMRDEAASHMQAAGVCREVEDFGHGWAEGSHAAMADAHAEIAAAYARAAAQMERVARMQ